MAGMELRDLRTATEKSQKTVADELGIGLRTYIRHESGETPLSGLHRRAYADYFGVDPDTIVQPERTAA